LHWDLMLEAGAALRTWRLEAPPRSGRPLRATHLGDHRPLYLDYEGPVSGDRGQVSRHDRGTFTWEVDADDRVTVRLLGERLKGQLRLDRVAEGEWTATYTAEEAAGFTPGSPGT
jgi:hypothetical protein